MNSAILTPSQPLAARFRLSRLFRILASAVVLKLLLVMSFFLEAPWPNLFAETPSGAGQKVALAPAAAPQAPLVADAPAGEKAEKAPGPDGAGPRFRAMLTPRAAYAAAGTAAQNDDPLLREALTRKQADLDRREQELSTLQKDLETRLTDLKDMEVRLQVMLKEADAQKDQKMRHLVDVYSNMKPKQAGQVLETLDERTAVTILAGMRGRQAGEILTFVSPEKAAKLSEMLTRMQMPFE